MIQHFCSDALSSYFLKQMGIKLKNVHKQEQIKKIKMDRQCWSEMLFKAGHLIGPFKKFANF